MLNLHFKDESLIASIIAHPNLVDYDLSSIYSACTTTLWQLWQWQILDYFAILNQSDKIWYNVSK